MIVARDLVLMLCYMAIENSSSGSIAVLSPAGQLLRTLDVPAAEITGLTFGKCVLLLAVAAAMTVAVIAVAVTVSALLLVTVVLLVAAMAFGAVHITTTHALVSVCP